MNRPGDRPSIGSMAVLMARLGSLKGAIQFTRHSAELEFQYDRVLRAATKLEDNLIDNGGTWADGMWEAANLCDNVADQCCGGSGKDGEGYRNLAKSIRRIVEERTGQP